MKPLSQEPWGVRRFFVRAPDGNVINVAHHPWRSGRPTAAIGDYRF